MGYVEALLRFTFFLKGKSVTKISREKEVALGSLQKNPGSFS